MGQFLDMMQQGLGAKALPQSYSDMMKEALAPAAQPTAPRFLDLISPNQFGSSLDLTRDQEVAQRAAERELSRLEYQFDSVGKRAEFEQFAKKDGNTGPLSDVNAGLKNVTGPAFDLLSIGNHTTAGFALELLRTGNARKAFEQAAFEFADALPGVEMAQAKKSTWSDVFTEKGASPWAAAAGGLALDIVLDPLNLIPGVALAKGVGKVGSAAVKYSGPVGRAFNFLFRANNDAAKLGEAGAATLSHLERFQDLADEASVKVLNKVDELVAGMQPHEQVLFGLFMQKPELLKTQLGEMARLGVVDAKRLPDLEKRVDLISTFATERVAELKSAGLIDPAMNYDFFFNFQQAKDPRVIRDYKQILEGMRETTDPVGRTIARFAGPSAKRKTYSTLYERLQGTLLGEIRSMPELNIGNILSKTSVEHERWLTWKSFLDNVVTDGSISARVVDVKRLANSPKKWEQFKRSIATSTGDGYDVLEVTRKIQPTKRGQLADQVVGAWVLPKPIVEVVKKAETFYKDPDAVEQLFKKIEEVNGIWKGWATFGTGYHARNVTTSLMVNWLAGVGSNYRGIFQGKAVVPGAFGLRYLQAMKLQVLGIGQGRLPFEMKTTLDGLAQKYVGEGFQAVRPPKVLDSAGKQMSWGEILAEGNARGVSQKATKYDVAHDVSGAQMFGGPDSVPVNAQALDKMDHTVYMALKMGSDQGATAREHLGKVFGTRGYPLSIHRFVGQMSDNAARWALYLDRRMKGANADEAAQAVKLWHFDYRNLSEVEKRVFRPVLPFYAWTRFAVPRMLWAMVENPARFSKVPKVKRAVESLSSEWGDLPKPDYYEEVLATQIPHTYQDKPLFLQFDLPVQSLNQLNYNDVISQLHPFVKTVFEAAPSGGYSFFLDAPIETFPGEESKSGTGLSKRTESIIGNLAPPVSKFLFRPLIAAQRGESEIQAASELSGVRIRALDVRRVLRARTFERRKLAEDFKKLLIQRGEMQP